MGVGRNTWSFFLKPELADDALDGAGSDGLAGLAQLLADDGRRSDRVQETVTNHLLHDLVGATIVGFGTAFLVLEGQGALPFEGLAQLEVALLGVAEFGSGGERPHPFALPFIEHGEFGQDGVAGRSGEVAARTGENQGVFGNVEHSGRRITETGGKSNKIWRYYPRY